ncbi:MAG: PP2C family protein-serine/threonine phosphatase [Sulfuricella sp.]
MNLGSSPIQNQLTAWLLRRTATTGVRRVASLAAAIASETGSVRDENQDRAVIMRGWDRQGRDYALVAVADGIGGMRDGATCAAITISTFLATVYQHAQMGTDSSEDWIQRAVNAANHAVFARFRGDGGSTLVALLVRPGHAACWLSVGDSRVYRSTGKNLTQISVDDTIAGQLGNISEAPFEQSKLLQFIGMGAELEPHIAVIDGEPIDAVVLTTDGVHYLAPAPGWLGQIVGNASDPGVCVKRLVDLAKWCGGPDNATVAMIALSADRDPEGDRPAYPCLEVWDAFGELQIIANEPAREASPMVRHHQVPVAGQSSITAPDAVTLVSVSAVDNHPTKSERKISKTRRIKGTHKAKGSTAKGDNGVTESSETEAPQLFMEFPNKSN